jgi:DNA-binding GntR family transcriptional regulator
VVEKRNLVDDVLRAILQRFDDGRIKPGQRVVAAEIAADLGFSRAPVREALFFLAGRGLLEILPDRGAVMRALDRSDLIDIWEILGPTLALGAYRAARRAKEDVESASSVREGFAAIERAACGEPGHAFYETLDRFHKVVNEIGENRHLNEVLVRLNIEYWHRIVAAYVNIPQNIGKYVDNYRRLTEAIIAGDELGASAIATYHARWSIALLRAAEEP